MISLMSALMLYTSPFPICLINPLLVRLYPLRVLCRVNIVNGHPWNTIIYSNNLARDNAHWRYCLLCDCLCHIMAALYISRRTYKAYRMTNVYKLVHLYVYDIFNTFTFLIYLKTTMRGIFSKPIM